MVKKYCMLFLLILAQRVVAGGVEFVEVTRIYTPIPFVPSMMTYSVSYMLKEDMHSLNRFEFYHSYVEHGRLFVVDELSYEKYKSQGERCLLREQNKPNAKELSACGRVVASQYVASHNVAPQMFGFKHLNLEIVAKFKDGVFYFVRDGSNVLLHQAGHFGVRKGNRYLIEANLSPYGDYDLREVDLQFDYEAYMSSAKLIQ